MKRDLENVNQSNFLAAYAVCGVISEAADRAGVARGRHYAWLQEDPTYKDRFQSAHQEACEAIETEIRRRAVEGYEEPVVYQGSFTYEPQRNKDGSIKYDRLGNPIQQTKPLSVRKFSDNLLMFRAKAMMPDKYRDNAKVEHTGPGGGPFEVTVKFVRPKKD